MTDPVVRTANDNLFGVCAAIGADFGFDPLWLRLAFAVALLFNLEGVLMAYAVVGLLVAASRLLFPNAKRGSHAATLAQPATERDTIPLAEAA